MEQKCNKTNQLWEFASNTLSVEEQKVFANHLSDCSTCSTLLAKMSDWKNDKADDNPYLAQKILDRITSGDVRYANTAKLALRWAFLVAIVVGISLGTLMQTTFNTTSLDLQVAENEYQENIDNYSTEIHYSELKTDETQQLLTDAR
jgi:predicted anti-sigma-YlaC factor YlaD